ncbi:VaFE repeat-containing surface-anchored protein [Corynebacterium bovis]|uniref:T-Q ester bond containing domain-containing protein n=1 Tax=Corynebacterium bovis TaxID=36808 RepID=A0A3R8PE80_9CORY|nr:VaFE repeat-containing surface-anchored protein [Corynebacterium bovis]RRO90191.1 hypothetical protein CXF40_08985 [Corynebacterium bovis]RRO97778.1 hypothetical protein CXF32_03070 [Corynebacterium bovis]RRO99144.1 hypothetical protein CXF31_03015 [Corynebacterium bovis]RRQ00366.1 hypothetical protein CXF41_06940 [Corynebacterium bovis]RRQ02740.1 hypothetical protein CXF42_09200 [Corynebacterium bovis]
MAVVMVWAIVVPHGSARADDEQGSGNGITITPIVPDGVKPIENAPGYTGPAGLISINDKFGYGWCIDYGISSPGFNPDAYTTPQKLTEAAPLLDKGFRKNPDKYKPVPIDGVRRDTAIYLVKEAIKAYKAGNNERAELANLGLQSLLTSRTQDLDSAVNFWYHTNPAKLDQFEKLTGYAWKSPQSFAYLEHTGNSAEPIPAAGPDEFITVIPPDDYSYERAGRTQDAIQAGTQRIILVDQPGLDIPEDKPSETPTTTSETPTTTSEAPTTTSAAPTTTEPAPATTSEVPAQQPKPEPKHPKIATQAKLDGKDQVVAGATVNDTVKYQDLVPGKKYTLSASLVDKSDESTVLGKGTKEFTPDEANGEVVVPITVDQSVSEPVKAAVAFEELTSTEVTAEGEDSPKGGDTPETTSDDNQVADHKDINDEDQTVTSEDQPTESAAPTTTTEAPTTTSEAPTTSAAPTTTSEAPSESSEAPISTKKLAPTESAKPELPVSEVTPKIQTEAKFADKKEIVAGTVVNDTVTYTNLIPGKQYTLTAELMDKKDGTTVVGHGSVTFTPESTDGSVVVPITVDDSVTEVVPAAVAFETLTSTQVDAEGKDDVKGDKTPETKDDNQVAKHRDITDQKQTVTSDSAADRNPKIATEAKFENKKEIVAGTKINDTVMFEDLVPNTRYTLTAQLMDKKDGTTVLGHGSTSFIPTTSNGSVVVPITVDESVTEPVASAVAFESLTSTDVDAQGKQNPQGGDTPDDVSDDNQIAEHKDINDDNQTVTSGESKPSSEQQVTPAAGKPGVPAGQGRGGQPSISTHAEIKDNGPLVEGAVVVDQVRFTGLQPGKKYTLEANLVCKADGQPTQARSTVEFVPNQVDGKVNVPVSVTDAGCSEQVVFETLKDASGAVVATHHDITDADQTVSDHDQPGPNGPGDDQVTPDEGVTVLDQGGVPDSGAPLPADAGRQEIRSIPSGAAHLDAGMPLFI